jgi:hypothetical protein
MNGCALIWIIVLLVILFFFFWWVFYLDNKSYGNDCLDDCGNCKARETIIKSPKEDKFLKICIIKISQIEHELDALCRSYIIEKVNGASDPEITYQRIEYLCEKLGDYISHCFGHEAGSKYVYLKKECYSYLKRGCHGYSHGVDPEWSRKEEEIVDLLCRHNKYLSREYLRENRQAHAHHLVEMQSHLYQHDDLQAMVSYDALKESTDRYVDSLIAIY